MENWAPAHIGASGGPIYLGQTILWDPSVTSLDSIIENQTKQMNLEGQHLCEISGRSLILQFVVSIPPTPNPPPHPTPQTSNCLEWEPSIWEAEVTG